MRGVQGAYGGWVDARLGGRDAAARPTGLGGDPQVAGVTALEVGDDRSPRGQPAGEDVHGRVGERERFAVGFNGGLVAV